MVDEILQHIPPDFIKFLLVAVFSLLIGLEQRRHNIKAEYESLFGTDRTFTLMGILGYILYVISPQNITPFLCGGGALSILLAIYYYQKAAVLKKYGGTALIIALITYCLAPLVYTQPAWLVLLIVVAVLWLTEIKETLFEFSAKVDENEFITLAKFLVLAGVILPLLPDTPVSAQINITPYKFGLAIVAVSAISYFSYLLKKFVFPDSGIVLTGILGGLYSSTATTIILARKSKETGEHNKAAAAIILATTMMYLRLFLLAVFFNAGIAWQLAPSFAVFIVVSAGSAFYLIRLKAGDGAVGGSTAIADEHGNPLEMKTAVVFGALFIFFGVVTGLVKTYYGTAGINVLSFVVGVTDIDPFILNLFQSKWNMADSVLVMAVLNAVTSNNLLKMIYAVTLSDKSLRRPLIIAFGILIVLGLLFSFVVHL